VIGGGAGVNSIAYAVNSIIAKKAPDAGGQEGPVIGRDAGGGKMTQMYDFRPCARFGRNGKPLSP
jgi:hypothetical protein